MADSRDPADDEPFSPSGTDSNEDADAAGGEPHQSDDSSPEDSSPGDAAAGATATRNDLTLPEALLLLALGDKEGRVDIDNTAALPYGLAAATLLTLAARDYIRHEDQVWKVTKRDPGGERALDAALAPSLETMAADDRERDTLHWLRALPKAGDTKLQQRLLDLLVEKGVLTEKKHRFLGLVPYRRYPTENPDPERQVRMHVRQAVLEGETPDDRTLALTALMDACGLTNEVFSIKEKKEAADRLRTLTDQHRVAEAISGVNSETTNAVLTATTAATAAATGSAM